jgi:hypothetical protein
MAYEDEQDLLNQLQGEVENQEYIPEEDTSFDQPSNPLLEEALAQRDSQRKKADLLRGFQQLSQALASGTGYKADMSMADRLEERSNDPLKKYKAAVASKSAAKKEERASAKDEREALAFDLSQEQKEQGMDLAESRDSRESEKLELDKYKWNLKEDQLKQSMKTADMKAKEMGIKLDQMGDLNDPEHKLSSVLRADLQNRENKKAKSENRAPIQVDPDNELSFWHLNKLDDDMDSGKGLSEYQKISIDLQERKLALQEGKEGRLTQQGDKRIDLSEKKFEHKKVEKDELSDKQTEIMTSFDTGTDMINRVKDLYSKTQEDLGFYASKLEEGKKYIPGMEKDPDFVAMQALVGTQLADYVKRISGAAVSEEEAQRLAKNIPSMTDKPKEFMRKLEEFEKTLNRNRDKTVKGFRKQGKDPSRFEEEMPKDMLSEQDKTAKNWAEANKEDPRAKAILEKLKNKGL